MDIGEYRNKVAILPRVLTPDPSGNGEQLESWPDPTPAQEYWAVIETPSGDEDTEPPRRSHQSFRLRFRTLAAVAPIDRVRLKEFNEVYSVLGVWRERSEQGGWQTVCDVSSAVLF